MKAICTYVPQLHIELDIAIRKVIGEKENLCLKEVHRFESIGNSIPVLGEL